MSFFNIKHKSNNFINSYCKGFFIEETFVYVLESILRQSLVKIQATKVVQSTFFVNIHFKNLISKLSKLFQKQNLCYLQDKNLQNKNFIGEQVKSLISRSNKLLEALIQGKLLLLLIIIHKFLCKSNKFNEPFIVYNLHKLAIGIYAGKSQLFKFQSDYLAQINLRDKLIYRHKFQNSMNACCRTRHQCGTGLKGKNIPRLQFV